jgi:hypothetical protein
MAMVSSGRPGVAVAPGDLAGEHGAHRSVDVAHRVLGADGFALFQGGLGVGDQPVVQRLVEAVVLAVLVPQRLLALGGLGVEDARQVDARAFQWSTAGAMSSRSTGRSSR